MHIFTKLTEAGCLCTLEMSRKANIKQLTPKLQAPIVREIVADRMMCWQDDDKDDFKTF
jgi:hypothetical protein